MLKHPFLTSIAVVGAAGVVATCTGPRSVDETPEESTEPPPPPFVEPAPVPERTQNLPDYGRSDPDFPFLPGEDNGRSRSVGTVTDGYLVNPRRLPFPHPHLKPLPRQYERNYQFSGDPMVELVADAAAHVADEYPRARVPLGNFSKQGGGNVPQSVSHNNGRDADIAFFAVDEDGNSTLPPDLLPFDDEGRYEGTFDGQELKLTFDAEKNWRFVEGLIESEAADIQYIFVSNPLRRRLLSQARNQGASARTIDIARQVLLQPGGGALPHDDHFHIRIHCTARDLAAGCRENGRPGPTFRADRSQKRSVIATATDLLDDDDPDHRLTAVRRLRLFDDGGLDDPIAELVDDPDPRVRAAVVRSIGDDISTTELLADRLPREDSPVVFAELASALSGHGEDAVAPLVDALGRGDRVPFGPVTADSIATNALVANALARLQHPKATPELIAAVESADSGTRPQIVHALRVLTNHQFFDDSALRDDDRRDDVVAAWNQWWNDYGERDHRDWIIAGFQQAGYGVDDLDVDDVWELCRAIDDDRHLNVNAQRILKNISGVSPGSLDWDPYDASFYWRRWFEERTDEFDLSPIPTELSTADGYTPPGD